MKLSRLKHLFSVYLKKLAHSYIMWFQEMSIKVSRNIHTLPHPQKLFKGKYNANLEFPKGLGGGGTKNTFHNINMVYTSHSVTCSLHDISYWTRFLHMDQEIICYLQYYYYSQAPLSGTPLS